MSRALFSGAILVVGLSAWPLQADDLPRRGLMGVMLAPVTEENYAGLKLESAEGMLVDGIVPDSAAAEAGMQANDVIVKIGDDKVINLQESFPLFRHYRAG